MKTDTPRTDALMIGGCIAINILEHARTLERELNNTSPAPSGEVWPEIVRLQANIKEIRAALGDDGRRTHKEILDLATKASQWREWKEKYVDLKNAHIAEGQDPAGTIWEHADKLQGKIADLEGELTESLRNQLRSEETISRLRESLESLTSISVAIESEAWKLRGQLSRAVEIAEIGIKYLDTGGEWDSEAFPKDTGWGQQTK